jgi:hypothetical protein
MKGISLTQPWATLVALEAKRFETRSWTTTYRGELLIHASKGFPRDCQELCATEPFCSVLKAAGYTNTRELPTGVIVAYVPEVLKPQRTEDMLFIWEKMRELPLDDGTVLPAWEDSNEYAFGDYGARRYAWPMVNPRRLPDPIACRGALSLWAVPPLIQEQVRAAI